MSKKFLPNKDVKIINSIKWEYIVSVTIVGIFGVIILALSIMENSVGLFVLSIFLFTTGVFRAYRINQLEGVLYE